MTSGSCLKAGLTTRRRAQLPTQAMGDTGAWTAVRIVTDWLPLSV
jgi:hypothetical protein